GHALAVPSHPGDGAGGDPEHFGRRLFAVRAGGGARARDARGAGARDRRRAHLHRQAGEGAQAGRRAGRLRRRHRGGLGARRTERRAEGAISAARARAVAAGSGPRGLPGRLPGRDRRRAFGAARGRAHVPGAESGEVMEQLWAPWRMELISKGERQTGCIFCELPRAGDDRENLILGRSAHTFAILNRFPYNNGHLMVVPRAHVAELTALPREEHDELSEMLRDALQRCVLDGLLPPGEYLVQLDSPKQAAHGDFAANAAMAFAKQHAAATGAPKPNPRALAQAIVDRIEDREGLLAAKPEIAGPGFLNIRLAQDVWHKALRAIWEQRERFGRSDAGHGLRTMVEFVSANPTGPMHVGHGRGAVIGDVVANLLERSGYQVFREFYINDAGGQVWRLAHAVLARATELRPGVPRVPLDPEDYQGEYVKDVARAWLDAGGDPSRPFPEIRESLRGFATNWILKNLIEEDLRLFGIRFDSFFSEKLLHDQDRLSAAIRMLDEKGMTAMEVLPPPKGVDIDEEDYVPQPLKVVKTTRFGDDRDRPLLKTSGEPTYFAADVAYHFDKLSRGYRRLIDVWGADHGGYVSRMKAVVAAMG